MKKILSALCYLRKNETMSMIEVEYPVLIDDMCHILRYYRKPEAVMKLFGNGNIMFLDMDPATCTAANYPQKYANARKEDLIAIKKQYPYVYLYDEFTQRWYFCHNKSSNYDHENIMPIEKAYDLNTKGELFRLPI